MLLIQRTLVVWFPEQARQEVVMQDMAADLPALQSIQAEQHP
jgi:hypothetical protein